MILGQKDQIVVSEAVLGNLEERPFYLQGEFSCAVAKEHLIFLFCPPNPGLNSEQANQHNILSSRP